jgi:hypothetical protein
MYRMLETACLTLASVLTDAEHGLSSVPHVFHASVCWRLVFPCEEAYTPAASPGQLMREDDPPVAMA